MQSFFMLLSCMCFKLLLMLVPSSGFTVKVGGDWYYKSNNGMYYYIPNKITCPILNLQAEKQLFNTELMVSKRDILIHLMPEYEEVCFGGTTSSETFAGCRGKSCSAVATLYNLIPGGGEKYLLSIVRAMQKLEQTVDILVLPGNSCATKACVIQTANSVNVEIDWTRANVIVVKWSGSYFSSYFPHYNYFAALGNEKVPVFHALGDLNFYMNQFPFDLDKPVRKQEVQRLTSYDWIVFNSKYSLKWYNYYINCSSVIKHSSSKIMPQPVVIYPPVTVSLSKSGTEQRKPWIVLTGRFFEDIQSKHHHDAIKTFRILKEEAPLRNIRLYLIGFQMPGDIHARYTESVKKLAAEVGDVQVLVNAEHHEIRNIVSQATVAWSMTGGFDFVKNPAHNPADAEHFGISILEAMSAGCIPVVVGRGGLVEIVDEDASLMCHSHQDCASKTINILNLKGDPKTEKIAWAQSRPSQFSDAVFDRQIANAFAAGRFSPVNQLIRSDIRRHQLSVSTKSPYAAIIVETRSSIIFKSVVSQNLKMLGSHSNWRLVVFHGSNNGDYCRNALSHLSNVVYKDIGVSDLNDSSYNALLKDPATWEFLLVMGITKVLVFQLDSLILKPTVQEFLHFDYIGAPWTHYSDIYAGINEIGVGPSSLPNKKYRVGNGGFSIRNVRAMVKISNLYSKTSDTLEKEDVFFVKHLHELKYNVAPVSIASRFAVRAPMKSTNIHDVFGIHQTWRMPAETFNEVLKPILNYEANKQAPDGLAEKCLGLSLFGRLLCYVWLSIYPS